MSLYQCEKCGVIENTALGWHWNPTGESEPRKLCSECAPLTFSDGSSTEFTGKWHGRFPKRFYPLGTMETDPQGNVRPKVPQTGYPLGKTASRGEIE